MERVAHYGEGGARCRGVAFGRWYELVRQEQGEPVLVEYEEPTTEDLLVGLGRVELKALAEEVVHV